MEKSYFSRQIFLAIDQLAMILYLCALTVCGYEIGAESYIHFALVFLMFADAAYVSYKNVQNNRILTNFTFWLLLSGWQFLLSLFPSNMFFYIISTAILPATLYQTIHFIQLFVFQASAYTYQKKLLRLLKAVCIISTVCYFVSPAAFAIAYLAQAIVSVAAILFIITIHYKQIRFFLKNKRKEILLSCCFVVLPFVCYVIVFHSRAAYLDNFGSYFLVMLTFASIHSIVFRSRPLQERFYALSKRNMILLVLTGITSISLVVYLFQIPYALLLILAHIVVLLAMVYNILLYHQICSQPRDFDNLTDRKHFYAYSLAQIKREESLRRDFSNYLHDDILQDLLSIKNLVRKAQVPEVQQLMLDTLGDLNDSIRLQMQACHPTLLKSLTLKENIQNMLDTLSEQHNSAISLDCDSNIFLAEPYNIICYRIIKELVTNAIKHSDASEIRVLFIQEQGIIFLKVTDDGKGFRTKDSNRSEHNGLSSIQEQVSLLDGTMTIDSLPKDGTRITVTMPMRGDDFYETFISG